MRKLNTVFKNIIEFPLRIFSHISPFVILRNSKVSRKSAILSGTRFYDSNIGDYSYIGRNCLVTDTQIGKFCSVADGCVIGAASHPIKYVSTSPVFHDGKNILKKNFSKHKYISSERTVIGNDVWIGLNVVIKSGVTVGNGAIIGAGAVVTTDVEPYSVVGGVPAKLIKYRFDKDKIEKLQRINWWDFSEEKLKYVAKDFNCLISFFNKLEDINE